MRWYEAGFTMLEFAIAACLGAIMAASAATVIIYIIQNNQQSSNHMGAVYYAETAGFWISRDAMMADSITTDNLTSPELLVLKWTTWEPDGDSIYHEVTYSIENLSDGIGKLERTHQDSAGSSEQTVIADYIYYSGTDPANSTQASYQSSILTLKVATMFGQSIVIREYQVSCRPNFQ